MHMKNWNRVQNAGDLGIFINVIECACMPHKF